MTLTVQTKLTTLALIGAGRWGRNYLDTCKNLPNVKIGYICAKNKKTLEKLPNKYYKTTKIENLLNKKDISGFIVASPTSTHFKIARLLIKNNKNVLIEKPLTDSLNKAQTLYNLSQKHAKMITMVGHIQIYDPAYQKLRNSLKIIGKIKGMTFKGLKSPVRDDSDTLEDWGPHPIYLFRDITGRNPTHLSATKTFKDNLRLELTFANKIQATADIGSIYPRKKRELTVLGNKGKLSLNLGKPEKTLIYTDLFGREKNLSFSSKLSPLSLEILEFTNCIKNRKKPLTPLKDGLEVIKTIDLLRKSMT